jgi:hypothetical protein
MVSAMWASPQTLGPLLLMSQGSLPTGNGTVVNGRNSGAPNAIPVSEFDLVAGVNSIVFRGRGTSALIGEILVTNGLSSVLVHVVSQRTWVLTLSRTGPATRVSQ